MAGSDVSVGFLKSQDDEFFFAEDGLSREWLSSDTAKEFIGITGSEDDVVNGGIYVNGVLTEVAGGEAAPGAFRAIYEVPGIRGRRGGCHQLLLHRIRHSRRQRLHRGKQPDLVGEGNVLLHRHDRALRVHLPAGQPAAHHPLLPLPCGKEEGGGGRSRTRCGACDLLRG